MKIPDTAKNWERAMRLLGTPAAEQVLKNVEEEQNVPEDISVKFFTALGSSFDSTKDPLAHLDNILSAVTPCALSGPHRTPSSDGLTRFAPLKSLLDHPDLKRAGVNVPKLLRMPSLIERITALPLGNRRGIVWAALFTEIRGEMDKGVPIEEILDRLGLSETLIQPMYQVAYDKADVGEKCHVPTVLDAGSFHRFRCSLKDARAGKTYPCSGSGDGFSEYVHRNCTVQNPSIKIYATLSV
jgi:hypothetical protein